MCFRLFKGTVENFAASNGQPCWKTVNNIYPYFVFHSFCEEAKGEVDVTFEEKRQEERHAKLSVNNFNSYISLTGRVREVITNYFKEYL